MVSLSAHRCEPISGGLTVLLVGCFRPGEKIGLILRDKKSFDACRVCLHVLYEHCMLKTSVCGHAERGEALCCHTGARSTPHLLFSRHKPHHHCEAGHPLQSCSAVTSRPREGCWLRHLIRNKLASPSVLTRAPEQGCRSVCRRPGAAVGSGWCWTGAKVVP